MDSANPPADEPRNFDPKRSFDETNIYRPFEFSDAEGVIRTLLIAESMLRGKTDDEALSVASHAVRIMSLASEFIDHEQMKTPGSLESISHGVIEITTAIIATNVLTVYMMREDRNASISVDVDIDDPPESEEERDKLHSEQMFANTVQSTRPILEEVFKKDNGLRELAWTFVWNNMFSLVLFDIDDELGIDAFLAMAANEQDACFDTHLNSKFGDYFEESLLLQSQSLASVALNLLNPLALPIDKLRSFIGVKVAITTEENEGRITLKDASRMLKLFSRKDPAAELEVKPIGDRIALLLPVELEGKFNDLLHGAIAEDLFREGRYTKEQRRKYLPDIARKLAAQNIHPTAEALSKVLGISAGTVRTYFQDDPELKTIVKDAFVQARLGIPE
ncbi:MAG: hypothetical protein AABO41_11240 [Acidobacteriota bacterium]